MDTSPEASPTVTAPSGSGNAPTRTGSGLAGIFERGSASLTNLSAYAFGLSGLWTGVGTGILPFKVLEIIESNPVIIFGYQLDKNGTLGLISLSGLAVAAAVQPLSGIMSDRSSGLLGRRVPYILLGSAGLAFLAFYFGAATSFIALMLAIMFMQVFGNLGQGPANALIIDHVHPARRGIAAGALNLARVLGAGFLVVIVLRFMGNYDPETGRHWLWASIIVMVAVLIITTLWTVLTVRSRRDGLPIHPEVYVEEAPRHHVTPRRSGGVYAWFLVSLAFVIAAMSSMQVYALFFLQDVVGLPNPANGADLLVIVTVGITALTVIPAGVLTDRIGRDRLLVLAGLIGATGALMLLTVSSLSGAMVAGAVLGLSVGIFLSVTWALANDLVPKRSAARDLGLTSIAALVGAAIARISGLGIDALNHRSPTLGYEVLLVGCAIAFVVAAVMLGRVARRPPLEVETDAPSGD
ncbi:MAG: MFS transporter [Dehalococcoidia bacterium]